jgi:hypothetical protein
MKLWQSVKSFVSKPARRNQTIGAINLLSARLPETWDSLQSFSITIPFSKERPHDVECRLQEAIKFRQALTYLCRKKYFPDLLYEELLEAQAVNDSSESPDETEERKYVKAATADYESQAIAKIGIVLLYEDAEETLDPNQREELIRIADAHSECRLVVFPSDHLLLNDGARSLLESGRYSRGRQILYIEKGERFSEEKVHNLLVHMLSRW